MGNIEEEIKKSISYFQSGYEDKYDEDEDQFEKDELVDIIGNVMDYSITSSVTGLQLESIINSLKTQYFIVPGFQRKFVWTKNQIAALALSVIKNVPIPPFYVYVDNKTKKQVILDGQQRVTAIFLYVYGLYFTSESKREKVDFPAVAFLKERIDEINIELDTLAAEKPSQEIKVRLKVLKDERNNLLDILKREHKLVPYKYTILDQEKNSHDISFSAFDEDSRAFLLRHDFQIAVVRCSQKNPQKTYANIFKVLNTGGKILGAQEIRNGVYWETYLYRRLFEINGIDNSPWRKIYGKVSDYSKDVEILLKMLALNHFVRVENNSLVIKYEGTFNWSNIMESYSEICLELPDETVEKDIRNLLCYLDKLEFDGDVKKCNKAVFEAVFVAFSQAALLEKIPTIKLSWLKYLEEGTEIFEKVLSNKKSVQDRLNDTLNEVCRDYAEYY